MKLLTSLRLYLIAALVAASGFVGGIVLAQPTNQIILTLLGTELIQVYSSVNNTAAVAYTTVASLRDGRGWLYNVPVTGFAIVLTPLQSAISLNPAGTLATGTITMPATLVDGKEVSIFSSQIITALTLNTSNGATFVPAAVTTLAANAPVSYIYDKANNQWHRYE